MSAMGTTLSLYTGSRSWGTYWRIRETKKDAHSHGQSPVVDPSQSPSPEGRPGIATVRNTQLRTRRPELGVTGTEKGVTKQEKGLGQEGKDSAHQNKEGRGGDRGLRHRTTRDVLGNTRHSGYARWDWGPPSSGGLSHGVPPLRV